MTIPFKKCPRDAKAWDCSCLQYRRRDFLRMMGLGSLGLATSGSLGWAQNPPPNLADLVPADKKLAPAWIDSLFERGQPEVYHGDDLKFIGMPVGGICAGQLYLGGDGKLWQWDIFNIVYNSGCGGAHYRQPATPSQHGPVEQGFAVTVATAGGQAKTCRLDGSGFSDVRFRGEYPIGRVEYASPDVPLKVSLEAFSPFIPLHADESGIPGTLLQITLKNTSSATVEGILTGWLENKVGIATFDPISSRRRNTIVRENGLTFVSCEVVPKEADAGRPDVTVEDWHQATYEGWTSDGNAFGTGPLPPASLPSYMGSVGGDTGQVVNSHATAPGDNLAAKDASTGKLTSHVFTLERNYLHFWIGGGNHPGGTCVNLLVNGKVVLSATGKNRNAMEPHVADIRAWAGQPAQIEIVDSEKGSWGNIGVGRIYLSDRPTGHRHQAQPDMGTMGLALFGQPADVSLESASVAPSGEVASTPSTPSQPLIGALGRKFQLAPGESASAVFAITWHFPNLTLNGLASSGRYYANKFESATAVARFLAAEHERLSAATRLWRDTWYDSTLPYWFLDRTFLTISTLATSTPYRFSDGRFYSWEGVGSCPGTCTHVWHYAHAVARLFPELERDTRHRVDLGIALNPADGVSGFRAEFDRHLAVDGQAGTLLRIYREHQMAPDNTFLRDNWSNTKRMFEPLLALDADQDGILEGPQKNTLDTVWFGENAWLSSLYLAALRAGAAMAAEMEDDDFAHRCTAIADRGFAKLPKDLFNGEYFANKIDPAHLGAINSGTGCEIDQVLGQSWAFQVGLPRVLPKAETVSALRSLWKYNFAPNIGPFRAANRPGRWYATAGEAGLLMCTFPRSDWSYRQAAGKGPGWATGYFNECMTGFEYQVAGHMIAEGLVEEGLAITRAIHDRYHPSKRNPWNEIECGDHYSRAMAGFGVFLTACGYEHHGPQGHLGFAPKLTSQDFRAPFTTSEGWGTFSQKIAGGQQTAEVHLKWGRLRIKTLALALSGQAVVSTVKADLDGGTLPCSHSVTGTRLTVTFSADVVLTPNRKLIVQLS